MASGGERVRHGAERARVHAFVGRLACKSEQCLLLTLAAAVEITVLITPEPLVLVQSGIMFGPSCLWGMEVAVALSVPNRLSIRTL
jgi:hypothetical protein